MWSEIRHCALSYPILYIASLFHLLPFTFTFKAQCLFVDETHILLECKAIRLPRKLSMAAARDGAWKVIFGQKLSEQATE